MEATTVVDAPPAPTPPATDDRIDIDAMLGGIALSAPLIAATILAFASGGYFITTWGIAALLLIGVVALVTVGGRGGVGGVLGITVLTAWLAFGAWQALSAAWSNEAAASQQAMGQTALYAAVFTIGLTGLRRAGWLQWLSAATLFTVWVPVTIAVAARLLPGSVGEDTFARLTWPITYWNGLGALAGFGLVLAIGLAGSPRVEGLVRAAAAAAAPVFGFGLYLTLSRGAIVVVALMLVALVAVGPDRLETIVSAVICLGGTAAVVVMAERQGNLVALGGELPEHAAQGHRVALVLIAVMALTAGAALAGVTATARVRGRHRAMSGWVVAGIAALVLIVGWPTAGPGGNPVRWADAQFQSFKSFGSPARNDDSISARLAVAAGSGRWQNWNVAWDEWQRAPIAGTGAGDYRFNWNQDRDVTLYVVNAHSLYLEVMGESGLVGLLLLLTPLGIAAYALGRVRVRRRSDPAVRDLTVAMCAAGVIAVHAAGDWDWQLPAVTIPAVLLGGAAVRAGLQLLGTDRPVGWRVRGPVLVACAAALLLLIGPVGAGMLVDRGRAEARNGNLEQALATARDAQALQGNLPAARLLEAYVLTDLGRHAAADRAFAAALARSPRDWSVMADWAAALINRGDGSAAKPLLQRARELNPREERISILERVLERS